MPLLYITKIMIYTLRLRRLCLLVADFHMNLSGFFPKNCICKAKYQYHNICDKFPWLQITEQKCCLQDQRDAAHNSPEHQHAIADMEF